MRASLFVVMVVAAASLTQALQGTTTARQFSVSSSNQELVDGYMATLMSKYGFRERTRVTITDSERQALQKWMSFSRVIILSPSKPYPMTVRSDPTKKQANANPEEQPLISSVDPAAHLFAMQACTEAARRHTQRYIINLFRAFAMDHIESAGSRERIMDLASFDRKVAEMNSNPTSTEASVAADMENEKAPLEQGATANKLRRRAFGPIRSAFGPIRSARTWVGNQVLGPRMLATSELLPKPPRRVTQRSLSMWRLFIHGLLRAKRDLQFHPAQPTELAGCSYGYNEPDTIPFKVICSQHARLAKHTGYGPFAKSRRVFSCRIAVAQTSINKH